MNRVQRTMKYNQIYKMQYSVYRGQMGQMLSEVAQQWSWTFEPWALCHYLMQYLRKNHRIITFETVL